jgi:hypothetical protein
MKTIVPVIRQSGLALAAAFALVSACEGNHVLGTVNPNQGAPGASGTSGTAGTAGGGTSAGLAGTSGIGSSGSSVAGANGSAVAGANGSAVAGANGSAVAGTNGTTAAGTGGTAVMAGPLGASTTWTGYVENSKFPSGSDALTMTFGTDANGIVKGTIVFGAGTPPPPATDPNVGYPVSASSGVGFNLNYLAEGYTYAYDGGSLEAQRLRYSVNISQLWAGWCAMQTPPVDGSTGCLPAWGGSTSENICSLQNPNTGVNTPVDCGKFSLCGTSSPCHCSGSGCGIVENDTVFDVFVSDGTASGSMDGPFGRNNVHFVKQ